MIASDGDRSLLPGESPSATVVQKGLGHDRAELQVHRKSTLQCPCRVYSFAKPSRL